MDRHPTEGINRRMVVFPKHKLAFILNAKAACSSFKQVLWSAFGKFYDRHDIDMLARLEQPVPQWDDYLRIAVVRHPFSRLSSAYCDKLLDAPRLGPGPMANAGMFMGMPFYQFVECVCQTPDDLSDVHVAQQSYFTHVDYKEPLYSHLVKLEELSTEYPKVCSLIKRHCGVELPALSQLNKAKTTFYGVRDYAIPLKHRFADDFRLFGYKP